MRSAFSQAHRRRETTFGDGRTSPRRTAALIIAVFEAVSHTAISADESQIPVEDLLPCKICGRTFFSTALKKHVPICQKALTKKRKAFDSSRQRAEGTDIPTVKPLKPRMAPNKCEITGKLCSSPQPEPPKKPSSWRRKHDEFIATIRAAKGLTQTLKEGGPLPPPPPRAEKPCVLPRLVPDYIQCPYCQRRFSESAAERHINFCKEQAARISNKDRLPTDAKGKPPARSQYKPPAIKKTSSSAPAASSSSRLPQRSSPAQAAGGPPLSRIASSGPAKTNASGFSPSRTGTAALTSPPSGKKKSGFCQIFFFVDRATVKSRTPTSPGSLKNTSGAPGNKRKVYNADSYATSWGKNVQLSFVGSSKKNNTKSGCEVDSSLPANGSRNKVNSAGQQTKFCHECGTKYPVEWAKFCCECGVRRMCI
ncbi:ZC21A protein, partial [Atractosteus spatula]|nr:ZC21A protein [Atractosteus spatula]